MQRESNNASRHHTHCAMAATDPLPLPAVRSATVVKASSDRGGGGKRLKEARSEWGGAVVVVEVEVGGGGCGDGGRCRDRR